MNNLSRLTRITLALGIICFISLIVSTLALTDIYHGHEADLSLEWKAIRITYFLVILFIVLASITLWKHTRKPI